MDTKLLEKKMESISPFELKNRLIDMADESLKKTARTMLNAGARQPQLDCNRSTRSLLPVGKLRPGRVPPHHGFARGHCRHPRKKRHCLPLRSLPEKEQ